MTTKLCYTMDTWTKFLKKHVVSKYIFHNSSDQCVCITLNNSSIVVALVCNLTKNIFFFCSLTLQKEVTRYVRNYPEEVCHIPRALDFFLTQESLENDSSELPWILTWARVSPVKALSLLCPRNLPNHPLTAQFAVRVLNSYPADAVLFYIPQLVQVKSCLFTVHII